MSRILVAPRLPTRNPSPALQDLVDDGYELVFSRPSETPDEAEMPPLHWPILADGHAVQHAGAIAGLPPPRSPLAHPRVIATPHIAGADGARRAPGHRRGREPAPGAADGRSHPMIVT